MAVQGVVKGARSASALGSQWSSIHRVQALPATPSAPLENLKGDLAQGKSCQPVEVCQGCLDPQGGELQKHQAVLISLLSTEGKIFFSILSRLKKFPLKNNYIDMSVQKDVISGTSGSLEHTVAIKQHREKRREKQGQGGGPVVGHCQCLQVHIAQVG